MLTVSGLHVYYGEIHALKGVAFGVERGEIVALLGNNGAGKTTTLKTISGLLVPRAGEVNLEGEALTGCAPHEVVLKGIAHVPEGRRIFNRLTVRENLSVAEQRRRRSGSRPQWTFDRVYAIFPRLKEREAQLAGSLSGGEQQMLAIGRALMGNPQVLLMDEPSEGLAPQLVAEVGRTIAQLKAEGLSIVLVEQNIKLTLDLADDVVMINTGRVAFNGSAETVRHDHDLIAQQLGVF